MKRFYGQFSLTLSVLLPSFSSACAPLTPNTTMLARLQTVKPSANVQSYTNDKQGYVLQFLHYNFVFRFMWDGLHKKNPNQFEATFKPSNVKSHDLVIALSDSYDGNKPNDYRIYAIAPVTCQNNVIKLGKPLRAPDNPGWNRPAAHCGVSANTGILDAFLGDKSQVDYLKELQVKYPTCETLYQAFPDNVNSQITTKSQPFSVLQWLKNLF